MPEKGFRWGKIGPLGQEAPAPLSPANLPPLNVGQLRNGVAGLSELRTFKDGSLLGQATVMGQALFDPTSRIPYPLPPHSPEVIPQPGPWLLRDEKEPREEPGLFIGPMISQAPTWSPSADINVQNRGFSCDGAGGSGVMFFSALGSPRRRTGVGLPGSYKDKPSSAPSSDNPPAPAPVKGPLPPGRTSSSSDVLGRVPSAALIPIQGRMDELRASSESPRRGRCASDDEKAGLKLSGLQLSPPGIQSRQLVEPSAPSRSAGSKQLSGAHSLSSLPIAPSPLTNLLGRGLSEASLPPAGPILRKPQPGSAYPGSEADPPVNQWEGVRKNRPTPVRQRAVPHSQSDFSITGTAKNVTPH